MEELIKSVSEKAGISEDQAKTAVLTVADYLKDNLPAPLDQQVDTVLQGGDISGSVGNITKGLGGLLGKK